MKDIAIKVEHVYKNFKLPHEKHATLKSAFTSALKGKRNKTVEVQHALKDISFEIKKGEFFGIVGRNGSGKSTLLKILAGIYQPTKGNVQVNGRIVPFIELGVGFNPELTGRENVYLNGALLGFSREEIEAMYDSIVEFAELEQFMDQKLKNYSSGMQVRLAFSMAIRAEADILLIDEVLAVGDADFQRKCFEYFQKLKGNNTTVILVTHDMNAVRQYCDRAVLIEKSKVISAGSADRVATEYTRMFVEAAAFKPGADGESKKRWGDGAVTYTNIDIQKNNLKEGEGLIFTLFIKVNKDVESPSFGFVIKNAANTPLCGTNTKIKKKNIKRLRAGQSLSLQWCIPNVFNDGLHYIDPAIVYKNDTQTADWWEGAASFKVFKESPTGYMVNPDIQCDFYEKD